MPKVDEPFKTIPTSFYEELLTKRAEHRTLIEETTELLQRLERCGLSGSADRAREQARKVKALLPQDSEEGGGE